MSQVYNIAVLRFSLNFKEMSTNQAYNIFKGILGEPEEVEYELEWNGDDFVSTDNISSFSYPCKKGSYVPRQADNGVWYLDYLLDEERASCDGLDISESLEDLKKIENKTYDMFPIHVERGCKLKVYDWYSGSDMPVTW